MLQIIVKPPYPHFTLKNNRPLLGLMNIHDLPFKSQTIADGFAEGCRSDPDWASMEYNKGKFAMIKIRYLNLNFVRNTLLTRTYIGNVYREPRS